MFKSHFVGPTRSQLLQLPCILRPSSSPLSYHHRQNSSLSSIKSELIARRLPLIYDYLTPQPSHLLNVSLADFLPQAPKAESTSHTNPPPRDNLTLPTTLRPTILAPTHHLIYFPPPIPSSQLLPDGTDPLQSPGLPFVRRMWAGGAVRWNKDDKHWLRLDGRRAVCVEGIRDVMIKGQGGDEKVFVGIERRVGRCGEEEGEESVRKRLWMEEEGEDGESGVVERRNIVFMKEKSKEEAADAAKTPGKVVKPTHPPTFTHTLISPASLLFRYSALTFNAHSIHLDPSYSRSIEGHRNLLVHGPLSFTLLISLLRHHLGTEYPDETVMITDVEYRNLSPLYADEKLKLCGRRVEDGRYEIWAETPEGGLAVRGMARTMRLGKKGAKGTLDNS
ncbi:MAG: hypothetical protein M1827_003538 [Pycnora praestabilis]|nr:MAG: hypothetical protein M1827_003538 [Pycnora praestabilis]